MARDFKIELDNVEMINGSDDLLKDTKVTKVTLTGENKLNSLNSTFENCTELTAIEGDVNLDGVSDMTEMTLNTPLDEIKVTNPTEENIQTDNSLNQVTNVKIGGTKYAKGGIQDVVGSLEWTAENFTYEDTILDNVYTNSSSIEENKNITISDTLEQRATSFDVTGQTYENLVNGKATENLLDEMSMQQVEGSPTQFTPHMEQPICLEYIEGQTYQNLVDGNGEETLISEYSSVINDFVPNTFEPPQNQLICLESMEGETYQNLIEGKGEYKLTDTFSTTWTESSNGIENPPSMIEIPEIWGNTVQGYANCVTSQQVVDSLVNSGSDSGAVLNSDGTFTLKAHSPTNPTTSDNFIQLKPNTTYSILSYDSNKNKFNGIHYFLGNNPSTSKGSGGTNGIITTDSSGKVLFHPGSVQDRKMLLRVVEGEVDLSQYAYDEYDLNYIQSVGDLYVDESGEPILDEEGNEQYKLEIESKNVIFHDEYKNLPVGKFYLKKGGYTFSWNISFGLVLARTRIYNLQGQVIGALFESDNRRGSGRITLEGTANITINEDGWYMETYGTEDSIGYITQQEGYNADTSINPQSNKTTILMPHQLKKSYSKYGYNTYILLDKIYKDKNKYYLLRYRTKTITIDDTSMDNFVVNYWGKTTYNNIEYQRFGFYNGSIGNPFNMTSTSESKDYTNYQFGWAKGYQNVSGRKQVSNPYYACFSFEVSASLKWGLDIGVPVGTLSSEDKNGIREYVKNNPIKLTYYYDLVGNPLDCYHIEELKILEKPSLETYSPKTYISTNTEVQPSQMTVINKDVKFIPLSLQPSKSYTIQLDSVGKDNKPITVNLGGTTTTIQPTNDTSKHHRTSITTPSELTTDNLDLSGEGVVVNDVMLFEGNTSAIKQDVDYMDGIQSIGEPFESRNLFDYTQSEVGLLDHTNGKISKDNSWKYTTDFVSVKPNTTYCISQTSGSVFNYKIVEYNSSKGYLKGTNWTSSKGTDINRAYNTFTTSANTYYLRLGWQVSIFEIQLEEDTFPTEFMAFDTVRYKLEIETYDSRWDSI